MASCVVVVPPFVAAMANPQTHSLTHTLTSGMTETEGEVVTGCERERVERGAMGCTVHGRGCIEKSRGLSERNEVCGVVCGE